MEDNYQNERYDASEQQVHTDFRLDEDKPAEQAVVFCPRCGEEMNGSVNFCPKCGCDVRAFQNKSSQRASEGSGSDFSSKGYRNPYECPQPPQMRRNEAQGMSCEDMSIVLFVCGLFSVLLPFFNLWLVSVGTGITGLILHDKLKQRHYQSGLSTAGYVMSLIGVILAGLLLFFTIIILGFFVGIFSGLA